MYWFYSMARGLWCTYQERQIKKGLEKYGVPLNGARLSWQEVFEHAVEENVDQMHYLTLLKIKLQKMQTEIDNLRAENKRLKERLFNDW